MAGLVNCSMKKYLLFLLSIIALSSCSNKEITPKTDSISGTLGKYYKIVNRAYTSKDGLIYIEFQRIEDGLPEPWTEKCGKKYGCNDGEVEPEFSVEFLDKNGNITCKTKTHKLGSDHYLEDIDNLQRLIDLNKGETSSVCFDLESSDAVQFAVSSSFEYHPEKIVVKMSAADESKLKSMVDNYQYMAEKIIKKQINEESLDFSLWGRAQEYANDIREFMGDYSTNQRDRFNNIERKLTYSVTFGPQKDSLDFLEDNDDMAALSSPDWDSMIDEFSDIVDKYITVVNSHQNGNNVLTDEISDYLDKINILSKQLAQANDTEITSAQKGKITALANELNNL